MGELLRGIGGKGGREEGGGEGPAGVKMLETERSFLPHFFAR